jgi:hypothetical protein
VEVPSLETTGRVTSGVAEAAAEAENVPAALGLGARGRVLLEAVGAAGAGAGVVGYCSGLTELSSPWAMSAEVK